MKSSESSESSDALSGETSRPGELVSVGSLEDFPEGVGVPVQVGARRLVIYRQAGKLHALKDLCPHEGEALHLLPPRDGAAVCMGHGWTFDLGTGRCLRGEPGARVAVYDVVIRGETVLVNIGR